MIHRTDLASYGWEVVRNSWGTERSYLKRDGTPKLEAASWVQLEVAKKDCRGRRAKIWTSCINKRSRATFSRWNCR